MRKRIDIAKEFGEKIAESLFEDFLNHHEYRGAKFTWEWFIEYSGSYAARQFWMNIYWKNQTDKLMDECRQIANETAKNKCKELVSQHGLIAKEE